MGSQSLCGVKLRICKAKTAQKLVLGVIRIRLTSFEELNINRAPGLPFGRQFKLGLALRNGLITLTQLSTFSMNSGIALGFAILWFYFVACSIAYTLLAQSKVNPLCEVLVNAGERSAPALG